LNTKSSGTRTGYVQCAAGASDSTIPVQTKMQHCLPNISSIANRRRHRLRKNRTTIQDVVMTLSQKRGWPKRHTKVSFALTAIKAVAVWGCACIFKSLSRQRRFSVNGLL
jgi:hypothetical protein